MMKITIRTMLSHGAARQTGRTKKEAALIGRPLEADAAPSAQIVTVRSGEQVDVPAAHTL